MLHNGGGPWWNVIITSHENGFKTARRELRRFGIVHSTTFFNVLLAQVTDIEDFLHDLNWEFSKKPYLRDSISRIYPMMMTFHFNNKEDFEDKIKKMIPLWSSELRDKKFHVRIHRRGIHDFSSLEEQQYLNHYISQLTHAEIDFKDPDLILDIETLDHDAGGSLWKREDFLNYPFLRIE